MHTSINNSKNGRSISLVTDEEREERKKSRIPTNTKVNTTWAVRCRAEWARERKVRAKSVGVTEKYSHV